MTVLKTYRAEVERDGEYWCVRVPELDRTTQARTLDEVEPMARDLIAIMEDVSKGSFDLEIVFAGAENRHRGVVSRGWEIPGDAFSGHPSCPDRP